MTRTPFPASVRKGWALFRADEPQRTTTGPCLLGDEGALQASTAARGLPFPKTRSHHADTGPRGKHLSDLPVDASAARAAALRLLFATGGLCADGRTGTDLVCVDAVPQLAERACALPVQNGFIPPDGSAPLPLPGGNAVRHLCAGKPPTLPTVRTVFFLPDVARAYGSSPPRTGCTPDRSSPKQEQPVAVAVSRSPSRQRLDRQRHILEHFQFATLRVPNHTAWPFAEKARFFRSRSAGRRCAAASHFAFFTEKMRYSTRRSRAPNIPSSHG